MVMGPTTLTHPVGESGQSDRVDILVPLGALGDSLKKCLSLSRKGSHGEDPSEDQEIFEDGVDLSPQQWCNYH